MNCSFNTGTFFDGMLYTNTAEAAHILLRAAKHLAKSRKLDSPPVLILERLANDVYRGRTVDKEALLAMIPKPKSSRAEMYPCTRCGGVGSGNWGSVRNGKCFKCGGTGVNS